MKTRKDERQPARSLPHLLEASQSETPEHRDVRKAPIDLWQRAFPSGSADRIRRRREGRRPTTDSRRLWGPDMRDQNETWCRDSPKRMFSDLAGHRRGDNKAKIGSAPTG